MAIITDMEKKIAQQVQGDIPLDKRPFDTIGERIGISKNDVIDVLKGLKERGIMRRFGAVLRHQRAGFSENAMVVWAVPEERCEETGGRLASYSEISHCYERTPPLEGVYNIFTMIHLVVENQGETSEKDSMEEFTGNIATAIGVEKYKILRSLKEFKKSSMEYF